MSANYAPVLWNRQKKIYDSVMAALIAGYLVIFIGIEFFAFPGITAETLIIRGTGTLAFLMLHMILCIGPLARLDRRFLPLLYNRRHFGVTMCCIALVHGSFNVIQFHTLGNVNPFVSVLTSNPNYTSLGRFPFEIFGLLSLIILLLMACTSHDFWLKNLTPRIWKTLHMLVYWAYTMLVMHVMLGVIQLEKSPVLIAVVGLGVLTVSGLHLAGARLQYRQTHDKTQTLRSTQPANPVGEGFYPVCRVDEIAENRAKTVMLEGENIAIFKYQNQLSAINNLCRHQNGPLGEGKIIDGCITCPWHGYQYLPHNGQSPPPFTEKVETYDVRLHENQVYVNPKPYPEGTERPPCRIHHFTDKLNTIAESYGTGK